MIYLIWVITVIAAYVFGFSIGYYMRRLQTKIEYLGEVINQKVDKPKPSEEPDSLLLDPTDELQEARLEMERRQKELNG